MRIPDFCADWSWPIAERPATRTVSCSKVRTLWESIVERQRFVNWLTCVGRRLPYIDGLTARFAPRSPVVNEPRDFDQQSEGHAMIVGLAPIVRSGSTGSWHRAAPS